MPNLISYDPAFAYEIAVIIEDGIRRMYKKGESIFYYITVMNETYEMPPMPEGVREGILKGTRIKLPRVEKQGQGKRRAGAAAGQRRHPPRSRSRPQKMLEEQYGVAADVWSVTSYQELYRDGHAVERWNRLHPGETPRVPYVTQCLEGTEGVIVAASDYVKALPDAHRSLAAAPAVLRSAPTASAAARVARRCATSSRSTASFIVVATLTALARDGKIDVCSGPEGHQGS